MSEAAAAAAAPAANSQGATAENLSEGHASVGSPAPAAPSNTPPEKVLTDAEKKAKEAEAIAIQQANEKKAREAEAQAAAAAADPTSNVDDYEFTPTGDSGVDGSLDMLKEAGFKKADLIEAFGKAMRSGQPGDINKQFLVNKLGEGKASVVLSAFENYAGRQMAHNKAVLATVESVAGGKEQWSAVRTWYNQMEQANPDFAKGTGAELRKAIMQGGFYAKAAAQEIIALYNADPNTKGLQNGRSFVAGNGQPLQSGTTMSRADSLKALKAAHAKGDMAEVARIEQARRATRERERAA